MSTISEALKEIEAIERDPLNCIFYDNSPEPPELLEKMLVEMASVRGKYNEIEDVDFSFYISVKNSVHGIRMKVCWNRERLIPNECGYIKLHGDYKYFQDESLKYRPKTYEIETLRYFAKRYKVLFAAVWEDKLDADDVAGYFKGNISWKEMVNRFYNLNNEVKEVLANCRNLKDLEFAVRKNNAFNMND